MVTTLLVVDIVIGVVGASLTVLVSAAVSVKTISVSVPLATPVSVYTLGVALGGTAHLPSPL